MKESFRKQHLNVAQMNCWGILVCHNNTKPVLCSGVPWIFGPLCEVYQWVVVKRDTWTVLIKLSQMNWVFKQNGSVFLIFTISQTTAGISYSFLIYFFQSFIFCFQITFFYFCTVLRKQSFYTI